MENEIETICDNCGNFIFGVVYDGDVILCEGCKAEFEAVDVKLIYIKNTGARE